MWILVALVALLLALAWRAERIAAPGRERFPHFRFLRPDADFAPAVFFVDLPMITTPGEPLKWHLLDNGPVVFFPGQITITTIPQANCE